MSLMIKIFEKINIEMRIDLKLHPIYRYDNITCFTFTVIQFVTTKINYELCYR